MIEEISSYLGSGRLRDLILISFEDPEIILELKNNFPHTKIDIFTKEDFVGKPILETLKTIRSKTYDALVISNRNNTIKRSKASLQLLGLTVKSRKKVIVFEKNQVTYSNFTMLLLEVLPKLVLGSIYAAFLLMRAWFSIWWWVACYDVNRTKQAVMPGRSLKMAYLRTDLSGSVKVGGSVSHTVGVVDAISDHGHTFFFISDSVVQGSIERNIPTFIIPPSSLVDFFDELQLIEYHDRMVRKADKIFRKEKPDVIYHRHSIFNFSSIILGFIHRIPVVLEVNYSEVWAKKNWSRLFFERLAIACERIAFQFADIIVVVSELAKNDIMKLGADEGRIVVSPNAVNPARFFPSLPGTEVRNRIEVTAPSNYLVIAGFIGTFTRWHGVETLFDAIRIVCKRNKLIHFLLIGEGNLKSKLELQAIQFSLRARITFAGLVPHNETPKYLAACDILLSPHLGFDDGTRFFGSPTKLFEYMAMGKAIIASNLEQIGEVIHDGVNGLLVQPGNAEELAEKIILLANNPELRRKLGTQARKDVEKNYTWEINAKRVLGRLQSL